MASFRRADYDQIAEFGRELLDEKSCSNERRQEIGAILICMVEDCTGQVWLPPRLRDLKMQYEEEYRSADHVAVDSTPTPSTKQAEILSFPQTVTTKKELSDQGT